MLRTQPRQVAAAGLMLLAIATSGCVEGPLVRPGGQYEATTTGTKKRPWPHRGLDFLKPMGTTIIAAAEGKVTGAETAAGTDQKWGCGRSVTIWHTGPARKIMTKICHMQATAVEVGDVVTQGQKIGTVGNSGCRDGGCDPHVHFEVLYDYRLVNPRTRIGGCYEEGWTPIDPEKPLVYPVRC